MERIVLDDIRFDLNLEALARHVHIEGDESDMHQLAQLGAEAEAIARPKAMYGVAFIEDRGRDYVVLDGVRFTSRVLAVNLEHVHRAFPYLATCGMELHEWAASGQDLLTRYWMDAINEMALSVARRAIDVDLQQRYGPGRISRMAPGSLKDWPIEEQVPLFSLLGDAEKTLAVRLTDSFLMIPTKSVSGIQFATEERFESCQLCPRDNCLGRRAPYESELYQQRYGLG